MRKWRANCNDSAYFVGWQKSLILANIGPNSIGTGQGEGVKNAAVIFAPFPTG
jgi:hypothetical protein